MTFFQYFFSISLDISNINVIFVNVESLLLSENENKKKNKKSALKIWIFQKFLLYLYQIES